MATETGSADPVEPSEIERLYVEDRWSIQRIAAERGLDHRRVRAVLAERGISIRGRGRHSDERVWEKRRIVALTSVSWDQYFKRLGMSLWRHGLRGEVLHGVRLGCRRCIEAHRRPPRVSTRTLSLGRNGSLALCDEHYRVERRRKKP